jgi:hypothetical protein
MGKAMTPYFNLIFYETMKAERLDHSEIILLIVVTLLILRFSEAFRRIEKV